MLKDAWGLFGRKEKEIPSFLFRVQPNTAEDSQSGKWTDEHLRGFRKLFDAVTRVTFDKNPDKKGSNEKVIKSIMQVAGKDEEIVQLN